MPGALATSRREAEIAPRSAEPAFSMASAATSTMDLGCAGSLGPDGIASEAATLRRRQHKLPSILDTNVFGITNLLF